MIKLVYCIHRHPSLSREAFRKYWLETHTRLVKKHAGALRMRRYVQSHTLTSELNEALRASRNSEAEFDGITEVWWDSLNELSTALTSEQGLAAGRELLEDEKRFIDLERSSLFLTEEQAIF